MWSLCEHLDMATSSRPIILVHGAWHGAWVWSDLITRLDEVGIPAQAIDLPGHGMSPLPPSDVNGDAEALAYVAQRVGPDAIWVGHSYGGAVISAASALAPVAHLVYVAAFALESGESVNGFLRAAPRHHVALADAMQPGDTASTLSPDAAGDLLFRGLNPSVTVSHVARLGPQPHATMTTSIDASGLGVVPSTYILCERDRCVHPEHQRIMAARCDDTNILDEEHSPFLSAPDAIVDILRGLATS